MRTTITVALTLMLLAAPVLARDVMYPTIPGTSLRDHSKPGRIIEGNNVYPTIPGTTLRDYSKHGYIADRHEDGSVTFHPTLPGTSIRDYGKTDYLVK